MPAKPAMCRARVTAVRALTADVREVDLAMIEPPALAFEAGQWVSVPFGPKTVRAYSIASTPRSASVITLCADVAPGGPGSRWFRELSPGGEVEFKGPLGGFVFGRDERRPLFVAEEIGIVPIRSILADLDDTGFTGPATLVYGARDPGWLVYDGEFRARARRQSGFAYHPVVAAGQGELGEPAALVERLVSDVAGLVAYVAGGETTIKRVRDVLMAKGLERKAVKWEKFW
jgi:propane monooxygenase reductase subunit